MYCRLSFAQYLKAGAIYGYKIWYECLLWNVTECGQMTGLKLLPFLSYSVKSLWEGGVKVTPHPEEG